MKQPGRIIGLDVIRAIAVLGMILVNFRGKVHPEVAGATDLAWVLDRMEGKWAAVFVVLAGIGIGMQARRASTAIARIQLRRSVLVRSTVLLVIGVLHQHWWTWDILAFYAVYISASVLFLWAPSSMLWASILAMLLGSGWQWLNLVRPELNFWTLKGAAGKLLFWGNHPFLPWFALFLFGLWISRQDLRSSRVRARLLIAGLLVLAAAEFANAYVRSGGPGLSDPPWLDMLRTWPRPTRPGFVVGGMAFATIAIVTTIGLTGGHEHRRPVLALQAGGQLALTLYIAHVPAILIPVAHGWAPTSLRGLVAYALFVYVAGILAALWWRRRHDRGPLESLLAALTSAPPPRPDGQLATR